MQHIIDHLSNYVFQNLEYQMAVARTQGERDAIQQELDDLEETIQLLHKQQEILQCSSNDSLEEVA